MSNNDFTNKATVKVVRQQLHQINDLQEKYKRLGAQHTALVNNHTDVKILNAQTLKENKVLKTLLDVAQKMLEKLREERKEYVEDLKTIKKATPVNIDKYIKKWEGKE